jgi:hypothetical protein
MQCGCFLLSAENERERGIDFVAGLNGVQTGMHALRGGGNAFDTVEFRIPRGIGQLAGSVNGYQRAGGIARFKFKARQLL